MICSFIENMDVYFYKNIFEAFYCKTPITTFDNILVFLKKNNLSMLFMKVPIEDIRINLCFHTREQIEFIG